MIYRLCLAIVAACLLTAPAAVSAKDQSALQNQFIGSPDAVSTAYLLALSTNKTDYSPGEDIILSVSLKNNTNRVDTIVLNSPLHSYCFRVMKQNHTEVQLTYYGRGLVEYENSLKGGGEKGKHQLLGDAVRIFETIRPGMKDEFSTKINALFQMDEPGVYTLVVSRHNPASNNKSLVTSNALKITVSRKH